MTLHPSQRDTFLQELGERVLIADGSTATVIYNAGIFINRCYDELNLSSPDFVGDIHRSFFSAGAEIIRTNTFGANALKLEVFGYDAKLKEINAAGVELAKEASRGQASIAGTIGNLQRSETEPCALDSGDMLTVFHAQAEVLIAEGVDLIILEGMTCRREARAAIEAVRKIDAAMPIVLFFMLNEQLVGSDEATASDFAALATELKVNAAGLNGYPGPARMLEVLESMKAYQNVPQAALFSAGGPRWVEGRRLPMAQPEYLAKFARRFFRIGTKLIGGCAGVTPEHLRGISAMLRSLQPARAQQSVSVSVEETSTKQNQADKTLADEPPAGMPQVAKDDKSPFARMMGKEWLHVVEIDPPRGLDLSKCIEGARLLRDNGVQCINIADGPRATARMGPMILGKVLQDEVGIETLIHFCTRDRNVLRLQADLMGMHTLGMHNVLSITGDPPKMGDYGFATAVFDIDSIGLMRMIMNLNKGLDFANKPLKQQTKFFAGVGVDPGATNIDHEMHRFEQKIAAGAEFAMTQPVYDERIIDRFAEQVKHIDIPIMIGILPLYSYRNAEFLHNEIPGMSVPDNIRERLKAAPSSEAARTVGVEIAAAALRHARSIPQVKGVYLMPPFGKYELAVQIMELAESGGVEV